MANAARDGSSVPTLIGVSSVDGTTPIRVAVDPTTGRMLVDLTLSKLTATGSVNGVNAVFTFTSAPTYIVSDHAWYQATNSNGTTNWTGTTTVTMTIPPQEDIFGF